MNDTQIKVRITWSAVKNLQSLFKEGSQESILLMIARICLGRIENLLRGERETSASIMLRSLVEDYERAYAAAQKKEG